jgi:prepilin-type N-terminal cleavage/methylation domain-containing protein
MRKGVTLVELLIVVAITAVLATIAVTAYLPARRKARDAVRVADINQMGRFLLAISCYAPSTGPGDYDLQQVFEDLAAANPSVTQYIKEAPRDPRSGDEASSGYGYAYAAQGTCALYANLEVPDARVTLEGLTAPTPGGGSGTLRASAPGPNGTDRYYQIGR